MAKILRAIKANPGIRAEYRRRLEKLVDDMHASVLWWARAAYRKDEERIVQEQAHDEAPWRSLFNVMGALRRYWLKKWDERAESIAWDLAYKTLNKTRASHKAAFKEAGMSVKMNGSRATNNVVQALIAENVSLIKSIPERYFGEVTSMVQRHISQGKNIAALEEELASRYEITRNRAKFIARDQSDKASEAIKRSECKQMGITEGIWVHVPGMKSARATHMRMNGKRFKLDEGLYDADVKKKVLPGELYNCFPGSTKLYGLPFIHKVFRHWYEGELAELVMDDGTVVHATPNHPILTAKGWKPAGLLDDSDYVVKSLACDAPGVLKIDEDGLVPTFDELFGALLFFGVSEKLLGSTRDFHGDGIDGNVDVIDVDRLLTDVCYPSLVELVTDLGFTRAETRAVAYALTGLGGVLPLRERVLGPSDGIMRSPGELLPLFLGHAGKAEIIGLTAVADRDFRHLKAAAHDLPGASEVLGNGQLAYTALVHGKEFLCRDNGSVSRIEDFGLHYPTALHVSAERGLVDSNFLGEIFKQSPCKYLLLHVVQNRRVDFFGHVYNLETAEGFYLPQKLFCHNCRCTFRMVVPEFGDE